ncbi:hypothetical protein ACHAQH_004407 [Verticillium albo-atrum]
MRSAVLLGLVPLFRGTLGQSYECDGLQAPNWDHCSQLSDMLGWDEYEDFVGSPGGANTCHVFTDANNHLNCRVAVCWTEDRGFLLSSMMAEYVRVVERQCGDRHNVGGRHNWENGYVGVTLNPDYIPQNPTIMSGEEDGLESHVVPLLDYEAKIEALKEEFAPSQKRQEDGDDAYILIGQATNVERSGHRFMVGTPGPSGTEIEISESESFGMEVGVSAEVGVSFLEIFSASMGFEASSTYETTTTFGQSYPVNCDVGANGVLYWYPFWDFYEVEFRPSGSIGEIWVPIEGNAGNFRVECLG